LPSSLQPNRGGSAAPRLGWRSARCSRAARRGDSGYGQPARPRNRRGHSGWAAWALGFGKVSDDENGRARGNCSPPIPRGNGTGGPISSSASCDHSDHFRDLRDAIEATGSLHSIAGLHPMARRESPRKQPARFPRAQTLHTARIFAQVEGFRAPIMAVRKSCA
jgi:hypothetical protein